MTTPTTSINLGHTVATPGVHAISGTVGSFFELRLGYHVDLILPGYDREAIAYAREFAQALVIAASLLERELDTRVRQRETEKVGV